MVNSFAAKSNCQAIYSSYIAEPGFNQTIADEIQHECETIRGNMISTYVMLPFLLVLATLMCFITVKVKRLVWDKDKILVLMLVCLTCTVSLFALYYVYNIAIETHLVWQFTAGKQYVCTTQFIGQAPAFLLSLAILLNLNKWMQYLCKIHCFVSVNDQITEAKSDDSITDENSQLAHRWKLSSARDSDQLDSLQHRTEESEISTSFANQHQSYKAQKLILNIGTLVVCTALIFQFFILTSRNCHQSKASFAMTNTYTWMFNILGCAFLITGLLMMHFLNKHYGQFFTEYKCLLLAATVLLSMPLFVRGINTQLMKNEQGEYYKWYYGNFAITNTTYVLISSILPAVTQLASLIFGARQVLKPHKATNESNFAGDETETWTVDPSSAAQDDNTSQHSASSALSQSNRNKNIFEPPLEDYQFRQNWEQKFKKRQSEIQKPTGFIIKKVPDFEENTVGDYRPHQDSLDSIMSDHSLDKFRRSDSIESV